MKTLFFDASGRLRNGWWCLVFYVVLAALVLPLVLATRTARVEVTEWSQALAVVAATWVCVRLRRERLTDVTGRFGRRWLREAALGALLGLGLMVAPALALLLAGKVQFSWNSVAWASLTTALLGSVAVAVAEELLFRGFVFQRLVAGLGPWPAQLLLGAYFVLTHSSNPNMTGEVGVLAGINIFVASLLFGLAFLKTRNLAMPLGLHATANWVQGAVLGFGVSGHEAHGLWSPRFRGAPEWLSGGAVGLEGSVPGLVCLVLVTAWVAWWRPRVEERTGTT